MKGFSRILEYPPLPDSATSACHGLRPDRGTPSGVRALSRGWVISTLDTTARGFFGVSGSPSQQWTIGRLILRRPRASPRKWCWKNSDSFSDCEPTHPPATMASRPWPRDVPIQCKGETVEFLRGAREARVAAAEEFALSGIWRRCPHYFFNPHHEALCSAGIPENLRISELTSPPM